MKPGKWAFLAILLLIPAIALAGWFQDILGAGEVAKAGAQVVQAGTDLAWRAMLLKAITANIQVLLLAAAMAMSTISLVCAGYLAMRFGDSCREAMRDDKVTLAEWVIIGLQVSVMAPVIVTLTAFGGALAWTLIFHR